MKTKKPCKKRKEPDLTATEILPQSTGDSVNIKADARTGRTPDRRTSDDPSRKCLVTGEVKSRSAMIRFVRDPEGRVIA